MSQVFLSGNFLNAQDTLPYHKQLFVSKPDTLPYRIMFPEKPEEGQKYPVIFFLHGSGERGNNNESQLVHGGKYFAGKNKENRQKAVVIFPQCHSDDYWAKVNQWYDDNKNRHFIFLPDSAPTPAMELLIKLVDHVKNKPWADTSRFYIAGLSMGGMGTLEIIYRLPGCFAAAVAICGGGNIATAPLIAKHTPVWFFHGINDDVVNAGYSKKMFEAIKQAGGKAKITLYPETGHNAWDKVFTEFEWYDWLMQHHK